MTRSRVLLFAVTCGAAVANIYYAQPLLQAIADGLGTTRGAAGLLVTASQVGYAAGLVLLVPLGDLLERRAFVWRLLALSAVGMALCAAAPSLVVLAAGLAVAGLTSVAAQVLVALTGDLADDDERGRVVGTVMSGLLTGILVARTLSGLLADLAGWRSVYVASAALMAVLAVLIARGVDPLPVTTTASYRGLLRSIATLVRAEPILRRRMLFGFCGMASFSALWTSLTFLLSDAPFRMGEASIGLVGLAGLAGAVAAQGAGRLADRGLGALATGGFLLAVVAGWVLCLLGASSLIVLVAGLVVIDIGLQGQQILNQSAIYALAPGARSRVTTAYVGTVFAGGAIGSAASAALWEAGGWNAVCALGGGFAVLALAVWSAGRALGVQFDTSRPSVEPRSPTAGGGVH